MRPTENTLGTLALAVSAGLLVQACARVSPDGEANEVAATERAVVVAPVPPPVPPPVRISTPRAPDKTAPAPAGRVQRKKPVQKKKPARKTRPPVLMNVRGARKRAAPARSKERQSWPAVDVHVALRALDRAGRTGTGHHMGHEHYFTTAIPFYKGKPVRPSGAERADPGDLLADLKHDKIKRNATYAWEKLVRIGAPAVPHLIGALDGEDRQQRVLASSALGRIGGGKAVDALVSRLKGDKVPYNALAAYLALVAVGREALPQLGEAARSRDRQQATFAGCLLELVPKAEKQQSEDR